jgi:hypothetical protein
VRGRGVVEGAMEKKTRCARMPAPSPHTHIPSHAHLAQPDLQHGRQAQAAVQERHRVDDADGRGRAAIAGAAAPAAIKPAQQGAAHGGRRVLGGVQGDFHQGGGLDVDCGRHGGSALRVPSFLHPFCFLAVCAERIRVARARQKKNTHTLSTRPHAMASRAQPGLTSTSGRTGRLEPGPRREGPRRPASRMHALPPPPPNVFFDHAAVASPTTSTPAPALLVVPAPAIVTADEAAAPRTAPPLSDGGGASSFEPRLSPGIAAAAAAAATPPIVFWARIFINARRAVKDAEDKEAARLALLARIQGKGGEGGRGA